MPESKAKEVAQLFGLELEEEFLIKGSLHKYKFTEDGLMCFLNWGTEWIPTDLNELVAGKHTIIKHKSILTNIEKEYLSNIIKPFRNQVNYIRKGIGLYGHYIEINIDEPGDCDNAIYLPYFKLDTMYKGMKTDRLYSLKELEL